MTEFQFPTEERDFSLLQSLQGGSGAQTASYIMGAWNYFPRNNAAIV
jgi:hypothetical protein